MYIDTSLDCELIFNLTQSFLQGFIYNLVEMNYAETMPYICKDPILFADYRTMLDSTEPRLYEDIQDYETAQALFQEVR